MADRYITNGASISWQNIIATLAFAVTIAFAGWSLFQTQFSAMSTTINENKLASERMISSNKREIERTESELKGELQFIRTLLLERRKEFVGQPEFGQQSKATGDRFERIDRQLQILESTRPTTGELQATGRSLDGLINKLEDRVRAMEDYIRGAPRPRPADPTR